MLIKKSSEWLYRKMNKEIKAVLEDAKKLAQRYKKLTNKSLGITGEVAEFSAALILGLKLVEARTPGYDALDKGNRKIQIKGRCISPKSKSQSGMRLGAIRLDHEWDTVLMVLLDESFEVLEMWESERLKVKKALLAPGSKARNQRGALTISKFKQIGNQVWSVQTHKN